MKLIRICVLKFQKKVESDIATNQAQVIEAIQLLKGAVMIVYPMGLPPYDPIRQEFDNVEDLSGTQVFCQEK